MRQLVRALTPVIQARAARALLRGGRGQGRDARQELADLVQEILLLLFRDDGRILRAWRPERGLSLLNYVGLVAEREVRQIARSGRRSPWALDPTEDAELDAVAPGVASGESAFVSRDMLDRLYARLQDELHDKALELFRLLVVEDVPIPGICTMTGLSADAVYAWRSRLLRRSREILAEIAPSSASMPVRPIPLGNDES